MSPQANVYARYRIRILIVADGIIHFETPENGFGLKELIAKSLLPTEGNWELEITTARRFDDDDNCTENKDFRFDVDPFGIEHFDEVWLFGQLGENDPEKLLLPTELAVLSDFMNAGGGVFATGDHADLGFALCGNIPRVNSMRKWSFKGSSSLRAPGKEDNTRIDTLREGYDLGFQMDDQSDTVPQEIRPKFFSNPGGKGSHPHPLLADRGFAITVLPDHMHEGECVVPKDLTKVIRIAGRPSFPEYPKLRGHKSARLAPEVVAISTSAGGYLRSEAGKDIPPVEPRSFCIIVAYDGHCVETVNENGVSKIGRVVVDASFHHFLDINLNGTGSNSSDRKGFYNSDGKPTKDYESFKKYYRNIVTWLLPPNRQFEYYQSLLFHLRYNSALIEELLPVPHPSWDDVIYAGIVTRKAISERFSQAAAIQCAIAMLGAITPPVNTTIEKFINPWLPSDLSTVKSNPLIESDFFVHVILGIAMMGMADELPADHHQAVEKLSRFEAPAEFLTNIVAQSFRKHLRGLGQALEEARQRFGEISAILLDP